MAAAVPGVEGADEGDAAGLGGPDGEMGAIDAFERHGVGAEAFVEGAVGAFDQQVVIDGAEDGGEAERVLEVPGGIRVGGAQAVGGAGGGQGDFEEAGRVPAGHRGGGGAVQQGEGGGAGDEGADHPSRPARMGAQQGERVAVAGGEQGRDVGRAGGHGVLQVALGSFTFQMSSQYSRIARSEEK